jgi:hypothetical protein
MYAGLGEVLPLDGPLYSAQDPMAAGTVALVTADWSLFQSGAEGGANFDQFQEAVRLGWVPNTPDGYNRFMGFNAAADATTLNAFPELLGWGTAWTWARALANGSSNWTVDFAPTLWLMTIAGWRSRGMADPAIFAATDAFNRYFPMYLSRFGGPAAVAATAVPTAPQPDPAYPVGVSLLLADPPYTYSDGQALARIIGWQTYTVLTNGQSVAGGWQVTPGQWLAVLPVEWRGGPQALAGIWGARWVGLDADTATAFWQQQQAAARTLPETYEEITGGTQAFKAWIQGLLPVYQPSGEGPVAPIAAPPPVPYIPGSQVFVPAPGSGLETTITLPGTTTPIPLSQLTPALIANAAAVSPVPPPGVTTALPSPGPATQYQPPGTPSTIPKQQGQPVVKAGLGTVGVLAGAGIVLALILGKKRRVRGYRKY